jgi:hypothetical protein
VVPRPVVRKEPKAAGAAEDGASMGPDMGPLEAPKSQRYIRWADLLKRVLDHATNYGRRPRINGATDGHPSLPPALR